MAAMDDAHPVTSFGEVAELVARFKSAYPHIALGAVHARSHADRHPDLTVECPVEHHDEIRAFADANVVPVVELPAGVAI
jgi:hypothetical protein